MNSVVDWLASIGLAQYTQRFVENDIDLPILASLSEDDLKELGVGSLGHRRKIMTAIRELRDPGGTKAQPSLPAGAVRRDMAERRQLSVMFCDLVDSTALTSRLDPEETRKVIAAYQAACSPIIAQYDGLVAKFMGDSILAYFGYPRAHEDDAERAVRAALDIITVIERLQTAAREPLRVRIGIATGLVVVGDLIGEGAAQEQAVVGDAPNLAARLQSLADPDQIVVAGSTRRLIGHTFRLQSIGRHALKGFSDPVEAWTVRGFSNTESRFEAARSNQLTAMVGRERESVLLLDRLNIAWRGEGQIILISGEAGIGKSRFAAWLGEHVEREPHGRMRYQCSPYHSESSLYPIIQQLERTADIRISETPDAKLDKLERVLAQTNPRANEIAPLFASLLTIPFGSRYPPLSLSPAQQRRLTLAALLDHLEGLARQAPVLMLFEDAHWADATSLELIDLTIERVQRLPVLFLITFRPEFEAAWKGLPNVTSIELGKLDQGQVEILVRRMTAGRDLPTEVMTQIVAKTDGVPLFVEELTKTIQESGILIADGDRFRLDRPLPPLAIPSTLQDSLMARLDRLSSLKEIVQTGAAIGREFSYALLQAATGSDQGELVSALAQLQDAGLLFRIGSPPDARYTFKHALVRDAAYESLLKSQRALLHLRIAEMLRDRFAGLAAAEPEVVAHHFTQAGIADAAIEWWTKAGDLALRRAAFAEAVAHLRKAIDMADQLDTEADPRVPISARLKLQVAYGQALMHALGWNAPQTTAAFARAREMATGIEDPTERMAIYYGLWGGSIVRAEYAAMREIADAFLNDAAQRPGSPEEGVAHRLMGGTYWFSGDYTRARAHFEQAVAVYDEVRHAPLARVFGQDVGVAAMAFLALVLWPLGEADRARRLADDALAIALRSGHVPTMAFARFHVCLLEGIRGDPARGAPHADALFTLCQEHHMPVWGAGATFMRGWADWHRGKRDAGSATIRDGLALFRQLGIGVYLPFVGMTLADAEAHSSGAPAGLAVIEETLAECERSGQHWLDAELHRMHGDLLLRRDPEDRPGAERMYRRAIAIAERQGTRSFRLRAALHCARMLGESDKGASLIELLGPTLEGFVPSPEFSDVAQAQALIQRAASPENAPEHWQAAAGGRPPL